MIIPYGSDKDDGFLGYATIGIVVLCLVGFLLTWPRETQLEQSIQTDSLKVWQEKSLGERDSLMSTAAAADPENASPAPPAFADSLIGAMSGLSAHRDHGAMAAKIEAALKSGSPLRRWGLHPGDADWFPALATHMFLHAGWMHLIGNMIFFFAFGAAMERRFGIAGFLFIYLVGGVVSALAELGSYEVWHHAGCTIPMVGASGAIAAAMGAFLRSYPRAKIKVFTWYFRPRTIQVDAWLFLGIWFFGQILYGMIMSRGGEGGTAYMAHVGGFLFGLVAAQFVPVDTDVREQERLLRKRASSPIAGFAPPTPRQELSHLDKGWDCMRTGSEEDARLHFTRQASEWIKGSDEDLARLAALLEKLCALTPPFAFAPLPAWEWGIRLANSPHIAIAITLLEISLSAEPPLPPSMALRARQTLENLALAAPPTAPTPPQRPSLPKVPPPRKDGRPGWIMD